MTGLACIGLALMAASYAAGTALALVATACDIVDDADPNRRLTWREVAMAAAWPVMSFVRRPRD